MYNNKIHKVIIFLFIAVNYSYILTYAFHNMEFLILSFVVTFILILIYQKSFGYIIQLPLSRWIAFYFVINLIWIVLPHAYTSATDVSDLFVTQAYLFTLAALMFFDDNNLTTARKAILVITLIAIFNNILEFFVPSAFRSDNSLIKIVGRSAGFYGNSNGAGEALILGMILSYGMVPKNLKVFFLLFALAGVIPTFSRTSISQWFIVVFILIMTKAIHKKVAVTIGSIVFVLVAIVLPIFINYLDIFLGDYAENILGRLDFFSSSHTISDSSAQSRLAVAKAAFGYFMDNPLLGAGHSFTYHWEHNISTHNIYLLQMAEYGILGIFIYPLLLLSIIWKAQGEARITGLALIASLFIIGMTSSNVLFGFHTLLIMAVMASWSHKSRLQADTQNEAHLLNPQIWGNL